MADLNYSDVVWVTPTLVPAAYGSGDALGTGAFALTGASKNARTAVIESVTLVDLAKQNADIDVLFFSSNPSASTLTDNATVDLDDTELKTKYLGHVSVTSSLYTSFNDSSAATKAGVGLVVKASGSNDLYAVLVSRGTPTYAGAADLTLIVGLLQD